MPLAKLLIPWLQGSAARSSQGVPLLHLPESCQLFLDLRDTGAGNDSLAAGIDWQCKAKDLCPARCICFIITWPLDQAILVL